MQITEILERSRFSSNAKSRGQRHLIVAYSFKRRKRAETVCFYEDAQIGEIIKNILWKSMDESEREAVFGKNNKNEKIIIEELMHSKKLTVEEMSQRSPPLLWSLLHSFPNQRIENVMEQFVRTALKELQRVHKNKKKGKAETSCT